MTISVFLTQFEPALKPLKYFTFTEIITLESGPCAAVSNPLLEIVNGQK